MLGCAPPDLSWDAWTGATALDVLRTGLRQRLTMQEIRAGGPFGALGAARVGLDQPRRARRRAVPAAAWHRSMADPDRRARRIAVPAALGHALDPGSHPGAVFHLLSGATMLGAFFIATDPVSAASSDRGRLCYGAGIGILTWVIRRWGSYPDGLAFAVLLMNLAVPLIDRYTIPRIYGQARD